MIYENESPDTIKSLLNSPQDSRDDVFQGWKPIHVAAYRGDANLVLSYIHKGCSPSLRTKIGNTPLMFAAENEHIDVMKILLENGVNINEKNDLEQIPFCEASAQGKTQSVLYLLGAGANPNGIDDNDGTPLRHASNSGHVEVVKVLIKVGADVNLLDEEGRSALYMSLYYPNNRTNKLKCARALVNAGSNLKYLEWQDQHGSSLLHETAKSGIEEYLNFLIEVGVNLDLQDIQGNTPLHLAIQFEEFPSIIKLLEAGANVANENNCGKNALDEFGSNFPSNTRENEIVLLLKQLGIPLNQQ